MKSVKYLFAALLLCCISCSTTPSTIDVLILTGHTNKPHNCEVMVDTLTKVLAEYEMFQSSIVTIDADKPFSFDFIQRDADVVVLNFNEVEWDETTKRSFEEYVYGGGGVMVMHEADNAFPDWEGYNRIIGLGGWYGRDVNSGPYLYYKDGEQVRDPQPGICGSHGPTAPFEIEVRNSEHPIMKGLPAKWMHYGDQLTSNLRGPAEQVEILATAYSDPANRGSGKDEPMIFTIGYGEGRIVQTVLGHTQAGNGEAVGNRGFQVTFLRSVEWVATGEVKELKDLIF